MKVAVTADMATTTSASNKGASIHLPPPTLYTPANGVASTPAPPSNPAGISIAATRPLKSRTS